MKFCEKRHSIAAWLQRSQDKLDLFFSLAVWGYYKIKGYEGSIPEGLFFYNFKKDYPIERLPLVFNSCSYCSEENVHYYRGDICNNSECGKKFCEKIMKRYLREWFVKTVDYEEIMLYKCNNQKCRNYYFHYHDECPLCSKVHPQRTTVAFQRKRLYDRNLKESVNIGYDAEINDKQIKLWSQNERGVDLKNNLKAFFEETIKTRPWMWALIVSMAKDELPEFDEIIEIIAGDWHPDKYEIDLCELIPDALNSTKKAKITMGQITKCLLGFSIEMQKRGIKRGMNLTDVRSNKEQIVRFIARCLNENS